ncbi:DUF423 domain-containing protein [Phyllobacterium sophorae]|jgi:uncharacterized membrane protein YgdD (TMEM256/DUF423 family)|uniref:DUF423 domain-containing protein n=1 Tax=Phyllobacterium sophorae TaxID=1520277 RepID=A0A2P7ATP6_9HYPH|nr:MULTISPECIES: DUF423 domain-containing protein [Phyllobacterium]PSH57589.1 DUF423 domain-containing protein [Phyllobacterium sophorae]UXN63506.1 DUF423 domain-containing protein [Phyllobacterium sp. A18/5-2]
MEINLEINRVFAGFGGLFGAAGIAAYAAAAHSPDGHMATIAPILFIHAPAFLALSILARINRAAHFGGLVLVLGLLFFIGDLASRDYAGDRLFAFAAPLGGSLLILGWVVVAATAFRALDFRKQA